MMKLARTKNRASGSHRTRAWPTVALLLFLPFALSSLERAIAACLEQTTSALVWELSRWFPCWKQRERATKGRHTSYIDRQPHLGGGPESESRRQEQQTERDAARRKEQQVEKREGDSEGQNESFGNKAIDKSARTMRPHRWKKSLFSDEHTTYRAQAISMITCRSDERITT